MSRPTHFNRIVGGGIALFVLTSLFGPRSGDASGAGTSGGQVLSIPVGARAVAMGEAYTALADDVSSLYWNPAGLALLNQSQASFMYDSYLEGASYSHGAVATPLENGGLGASFSYLSFGKIKGYDMRGDPAADVSASNGVATVGGAWLGDFWSLGLNVKGVKGTLADEKTTGIASDLGVNLIYPKEVMTGTVRFGATIRNLGTGLKYIQENDPFPREWRLGLSAVQMMNRKLNLSMDYGRQRDSKGSIYMGAEYWLGSMLALRAGYAGNHTESSGIRAGMGLRVGDVSFNYAFSPYGDLGLTHRYELTVRFGAIRPLLTPEERRILRQGKQAMSQGRYGEAVMLFDSLIDLQPRYKPAHRLAKQAMKANEKTERLAKGQSNFKLGATRNSKKVSEDPGELAELENLLNLSEPSMATAKRNP